MPSSTTRPGIEALAGPPAPGTGDAHRARGAPELQQAAVALRHPGEHPEVEVDDVPAGHHVGVDLPHPPGEDRQQLGLGGVGVHGVASGGLVRPPESADAPRRPPATPPLRPPARRGRWTAASRPGGRSRCRSTAPAGAATRRRGRASARRTPGPRACRRRPRGSNGPGSPASPGCPGRSGSGRRSARRPRRCGPRRRGGGPGGAGRPAAWPPPPGPPARPPGSPGRSRRARGRPGCGPAPGRWRGRRSGAPTAGPGPGRSRRSPAGRTGGPPAAPPRSGRWAGG